MARWGQGREKKGEMWGQVLMRSPVTGPWAESVGWSVIRDGTQHQEARRDQQRFLASCRTLTLADTVGHVKGAIVMCVRQPSLRTHNFKITRNRSTATATRFFSLW